MVFLHSGCGLMCGVSGPLGLVRLQVCALWGARTVDSAWTGDCVWAVDSVGCGQVCTVGLPALYKNCDKMCTAGCVDCGMCGLWTVHVLHVSHGCTVVRDTTALVCSSTT